MKQKAQELINQAKAVIFDMDGVIIHSTPSWRAAKLLFLARRGVTNINQIDAVGRMVGMGLKEVIQIYKNHFHLEGNLEDFFTEWSDLSYEHFMAEKQDVLDGVKDFIQYLYTTHKKPLAIATGGYVPERIQTILEQYNLDEYFSHIATSSQVAKGKPHPDIYLHVAGLLEVAPEVCLVIEDSPHGVIAAKQAGMQVIGVYPDKNLFPKLQEAGADVVIKSLQELITNS